MKQQRNVNINNKIIMQFLSNLYIKSQRKHLCKMMSTTANTTIRRVVVILNAISFVDATTNTMPQKVNP
jgi:hypothetical protein